MKQPKIILAAIAFIFLTLLNAPTFAQTETVPKQIEPSYDVMLNVVTASNNAGEKKSVPSSLANAVKKLKNIYAFTNYRLDYIYLQRIANNGIIDFKGVANENNQNIYAPVFSEWGLGKLSVLPDAKGRNAFQIDNFRFGQRIPIRSAGFKSDNEQQNLVITYEQVGVKLINFSLPENIPTVIGTLSTSKTDEMVFLILTIKSADE